MIRSVRLRLTAWYLAFFTALFALFGIFVYGATAHALQERMDEALRTEVNTAVGIFEDEMDETDGDIGKAAATVAAGMRVRRTLVAVIAEGRLLAATGPASGTALGKIVALSVAETPPAGMRAGRKGGDPVWTVDDYGSHGARVAVRRVTARGRDVFVIALDPLDAIAGEMRELRGVLLIALPLLLVIAGAGGFWLTTRSLAPLGWMATQAREIGGASLHRRLEIGKAADELMVLSASFNDLLTRLDRSFETMRRFVADASHELRTPLSVIRGEADVALSQERSAGEYKASLAIVLDESRRLSRLVDDLLNLARADSGYVKLRVEEFYANDLLSECCRAAQTAAKARRIELSCSAGADAPYKGDEELLRRLVMNLLDNAIRYTPLEGAVSASLKLESEKLEIRISDTGPGIAPEISGRIFERFYRVDEARSRQDGGFGLGLSIVKWIAEAHHGTVACASRPGAGTTFTVTLPR